MAAVRGGAADEAQGLAKEIRAGSRSATAEAWAVSALIAMVDDQVGPDLLVHQVGEPGPQDPAGTAQVGLELIVAGQLQVLGGQRLTGPAPGGGATWRACGAAVQAPGTGTGVMEVGQLRWTCRWSTAWPWAVPPCSMMRSPSGVTPQGSAFAGGIVTVSVR